MLRLAILGAFAASPALAAEGKPFFSLANTDFVVTLSFLLFIGVLVYLGVPGLLTKQLDKRAEGIQTELDEAKALREEAQTLLASYERKQREVQDQADRIVAQAKQSAEDSAAEAKANLERQIERRVAAAEDQIASAEAAAVAQVRNEAARIAIAAAGEAISAEMSDSQRNAMIDASIDTVGQKLH